MTDTTDPAAGLPDDWGDTQRERYAGGKCYCCGCDGMMDDPLRRCLVCWGREHGDEYLGVTATPTASPTAGGLPHAINDHERSCPDCQRVIADERRAALQAEDTPRE